MSQEESRASHEWDSEPEEQILRSTPAPEPAPVRALGPAVPTDEGARIFYMPPSSQPEVTQAPAEEDRATIQSFFAEIADDKEPFDLPGAEKVGIIGGKGVGKSYLFQAMVYRTYAGIQSGAMTYFIENDATRLFSALKRTDRASTVNLANFVKNYETWRRLPQTLLDEQKWYRLRLPFRAGWLGGRRSALDVEYFDGSGEGFFQAVRNAQNADLWRQGYLDARVMVFCLPLWAAFPGSGLSEQDWQWRDGVIEGFEQVVQNYLDVRRFGKREHPVATILALTMADDPRSALSTLRQRWIAPYAQASHVYLKQLRTGSGVALYLANARRISEALADEFRGSRDPKVASIPQKLDLGAGPPWLVPVSAIDGTFLDELEKQYPGQTPRPRLPGPVPIHVELPFLLALAERDNALM